MVKLEDLARDFVLIQPKLDLVLVEVEAHEDGPWGGVVESLHGADLAHWIVGTYVDVLAADGADDLPNVHTSAERHVREDKLLLALLGGFLAVALALLLLDHGHFKSAIGDANRRGALRILLRRRLEPQDAHVVLEAPGAWSVLEAALNLGLQALSTSS